MRVAKIAFPEGFGGGYPPPVLNNFEEMPNHEEAPGEASLPGSEQYLGFPSDSLLFAEPGDLFPFSTDGFFGF
jgi:hypothetical protein